MVLAEGKPRLVYLLATLLVTSFAGLGARVALSGDLEQMSGGLFFLPREFNLALGRVCFGSGAVLCLRIAIIMAFRGLRNEI